MHFTASNMDSTLTKHNNKALSVPKPLLQLKDYLLDDLNSCSSNGFKSFPRRQCCTTTVRFLIEFDLKNTKHQKKHLVFKNTPPSLLRNPSKSALSAFRTLIAAVKRLPFPAAGLSKRKSVKKTLMNSSFWKRKSIRNEIDQRCKPFDQFLKENSEPLDSKNSNLSEVRNSAVKMLKDGDVLTDSTTTSDCSATNSSSQKQWSVNEDVKEQFSPVSVLDCPFDDDDDISSPLFQHMKGSKKIMMEKIHNFGYISQLEPLNLTKRFALASTVISKIEEGEEDDDDEAEQKTMDLLYTLPSYGLKIKADHKLLLDFFREKHKEQDLCDHPRQWGRCSFDEDLLEDAENWINGRNAHEMFLGWEVARNRQAYIKDMEVKWRSFDEDVEEVASELEVEVFADLFNELLLDISSMST